MEKEIGQHGKVAYRRLRLKEQAERRLTRHGVGGAPKKHGTAVEARPLLVKARGGLEEAFKDKKKGGGPGKSLSTSSSITVIFVTHEGIKAMNSRPGIQNLGGSPQDLRIPPKQIL